MNGDGRVGGVTVMLLHNICFYIYVGDPFLFPFSFFVHKIFLIILSRFMF